MNASRDNVAHIERTPADAGVDALAELLSERPAVALVGAGCSTASGIPDYRGPTTRAKTRNPIRFQEFTRDPAARQRYWARSMVGWPRFRAASPNAAHRAIAALERCGALRGVITQNVDRLHQRAGSRNVVELHGALAEVCCLSCGVLFDRDEVQQRLAEANPGWTARAREIAPDGDAVVREERIASFSVVACTECGGVLKPNVVFFGENVPRPVKDAAFSLFDEAESLLIVGSSLTVYSGYRFVPKAVEHEIPVAIVNLGPVSRGGDRAQLWIDERVDEILPQVAERLG